MLSILSNKTKFCDETTRREILRLGGLGVLGLGGLSGLDLPAHGSEQQGNQFGRAKSVVLVTLYGGPPQTETFDMKPHAPVETRGPFKPIPTDVVDLHICEHLPRLAKLAHLYTVARSFSHTNTAHGTSLYTHLTGWPHPLKNQNFPASPDDSPHYGALLSKLKPPPKDVPASVIVGGRILPQYAGIGQTGGFLGKAHEPFLFNDQMKSLLTLEQEITSVRMTSRQQLLDQLQVKARFLEQQRPAANFTTVQEQAFKLLASRDVIPAFDLNDEPDKTWDAYGRFFLAENLVLARRLVAAGVPVIQVSDIPKGREQHWDLHYSDIFRKLKGTLLPRLDRALAAFLTDLEQQGLLDQTLVIVGGEFGRAPWIDRLTNPPNGGRKHWPYCYSMLLAGAGIRRGEVFGKSNGLAAYPVSHKVSPWDLGATLLHLAGVDPASTIKDRRGRVKRICRGSVISELI